MSIDDELKNETQNLSVLYVEDEDEIREELLEILSLDFNTIFVASNGEEGLELFKKHRPELVISDIQMPKMDGLTMCKNIQRVDQDIPIILVTAFNEQGYIDEAIDLNMRHFISKPISLYPLVVTFEFGFGD